MKRAIDLVAGTLLALAAIPVIILLAIVVALHLRQWPFFVQARVGRRGRLFSFPKLRTMPKEAPKYAVKGEEELSRVQIPPFLQFMRTTHLDELPQLFLVPIGTMSLVGPRPKMPDNCEDADEVYKAVRTQVPQGCTGLWQVGSHTHLLPSDSPQYDFFYVEHWSVALDLWILWRTLLQFVGLGSPVALEDIPAWVTRGAQPVYKLPSLDSADESASLSEVAV